MWPATNTTRDPFTLSFTQNAFQLDAQWMNSWGQRGSPPCSLLDFEVDSYPIKQEKDETEKKKQNKSKPQKKGNTKVATLVLSIEILSEPFQKFKRTPSAQAVSFFLSHFFGEKTTTTTTKQITLS